MNTSSPTTLTPKIFPAMSYDKGILIAASHHIEWLLPWFIYTYQRQNTLPIACVDLGLSPTMRAFCASKGSMITPSIPFPLITTESIHPDTKNAWTQVLGEGMLEVRKQWFKKVVAFASTPFPLTLWLDIDCEVRANIEPIFSQIGPNIDLALTPEPPALQKGFTQLGFCLPGEITYNTGVVLYRKESPFLQAWQKEVWQHNALHIGDQEALSRVLFTQPVPFALLDPLWNWDRGLGENQKAAIFHWHGEKGKRHLAQEIECLRALQIIP